MSLLLRVWVLLPVLLLAACSSMMSSSPVSPSSSSTQASKSGSLRFEPMPVAALPGWSQLDLHNSLSAFKQSCRLTARTPQWAKSCNTLAQLDPQDSAAVRRYFETGFTAWKMRDGWRDTGLITGYYEPLLKGSRTQSAQTPYPVYGVPEDLVSLSLPANARNRPGLWARKVSAHRLALVTSASAESSSLVQVNPTDFPAENRSVLKGRIQGNRLVPYFSRAEIAAGHGIARAPVLAWVEDPVELFFLQIQGAGRIQLANGQILRLGVGDHNGYAYHSIGRWLADNGQLSLSSASMEGIQAWLRLHPDQQQSLFNVNPRYIFFRVLPSDSREGPVGAQGVPLTEGYSIAVDPDYIPLGSPVFLATTQPMSQQPLNRLVLAQDTGSAIRGALRADFFWGFGPDAGVNAGRMKQNGTMWLLLPNGMRPAI